MEESNHTDKEIEKKVNEYGGLITKDKAVELLNKPQQQVQQQRRKVTVATLAQANEGDVVDMEDTVYRVFNKIRTDNTNPLKLSRSVVFGVEGSCSTAVLFDKSALLVDSAEIQRKDKAIATNLRVKKVGDELQLYATAGTYLSRVSPSRTHVGDFLELKGGERNIDIAGRIATVGVLSSYKGIDGKENAVSECSITDGKIEMRVSLWKSSSTYVKEMRPGDYVKIEFATTKATERGIEVSANDSSRILLSRKQF